MNERPRFASKLAGYAPICEQISARVRMEFLLYDVTSTFFEGRAEKNPKASLGHGRTSRWQGRGREKGSRPVGCSVRRSRRIGRRCGGLPWRRPDPRPTPSVSPRLRAAPFTDLFAVACAVPAHPLGAGVTHPTAPAMPPLPTPCSGLQTLPLFLKALAPVRAG